jgi:molybdenum-dependent DNA-binding transcriptional regulator ModE
MKKELEREYQDIFVTAEKNGKKKGGSLGAVFKLIQELAEFEAKIQECADAQEMAQNKEQIMAFADQLDQMYDVLFKMGRAGIQEVRGGREQLAEEVD